MKPWFEVCIPVLILPAMLVILLCIYATSSYLLAHKGEDKEKRSNAEGALRAAQAALENLKVPS